MKRKMKRFAEGDSVVDDSLLDNKDNIKSIGDDVRARAMKYIQTGKKDDEESEPAKKTTIAKKVTAAKKEDTPKEDTPKEDVSKEEDSKEDTSDKKSSRRDTFKQDIKNYGKSRGIDLKDRELALNLMPGAGAALKGLKNAASNLAEKQVAKEAEKQAAKMAEKTAVRKSSEGYSPQEALRKIDEPARKIRTESSGAMKGDFKPDEIREGFKSGGMARSSASKRADGIATKGFTRACGGGMMKGKK